jgi:hypothetical protein
MKKIIFATMVAIAMLVGIQPVFAEQFIVPEVSTSDSQCYVLDLPAGATAEAPEYTAPWQQEDISQLRDLPYGDFSGQNVIINYSCSSTNMFSIALQFTFLNPTARLYITVNSSHPIITGTNVSSLIDSSNWYVDTFYYNGVTNIEIKIVSNTGYATSGHYGITT